MQCQSFKRQEQVRAFILDLWHNLDSRVPISVYHEWIERLEHVIVMNGLLSSISD
jgi:hypothetical protein